MGRRVGRRAIWGGTLLLIGLLLLASNLGYLKPFSFWGLWPILVLWPALRLATRDSVVTVGHHRRWLRFGPNLGLRLLALWVVVGALAQLLHNLGLIAYDWGFVAYWTLPVLLVGLGVILLTRRGRQGWGWTGRARAADEEGQDVSSFVGELAIGLRPWVFRSPMTVDIWAGDVDVDLTTAQLRPGVNALYVSAWAGDIDVRVPDEVDVVVEAHCFAGELDVLGRRRSGIGSELKVSRRVGESAADAAGEGPPAEPEGGALEASGTAGPVGGPAESALFICIDLTFGNVRVWSE